MIARMMNGACKFLLAFTAPATFLLGVWLGGGWTFLTVGYTYVFMPLVEPLVGYDKAEGEAEVKAEAGPPRRRSALGRAILWSWLPMKAGLLIYALGLIAGGALSTLEIIGVSLSFGLISGGISIVFAHELMHAASRAERAMAEALMSSCTYTHFCIEHVAGHHRRVATREDPASARYGESLYAFMPRSIGGGLKSAWRIEKRRLGKKGLGLWSLENRMLRYGAEVLALYALVAWGFGAAGVLFMLAQSYFAVSLLETVNYLEHYGLERQRLEDGRYERVRVQHSWDTGSRVTNWHTLNLGRHADHHGLASRPFEHLQLHRAAPQLPAGYSTMLLMAMVPPLWFHYMNRRLAVWRQEREGP